MKGVFLGIVLGSMVSTGVAWGNLFEVKEAVEDALCRKLATDYANDPKAFTVQSIAQLQISLAQTVPAFSPVSVARLGHATRPGKPRGGRGDQLGVLRQGPPIHQSIHLDGRTE